MVDKTARLVPTMSFESLPIVKLIIEDYHILGGLKSDRTFNNIKKTEGDLITTSVINGGR